MNTSITGERVHARRRRLIQAAGVGLLAAHPLARASKLDVRTIKTIVGYPAGGGVDVLARIVSNPLGAALGVPVVVENRSGASGTIAAAELNRAQPDGSVLHFADSGILAAPAIIEKLSFDPSAFTAIGPMGQLSFAIVVAPDFPAKDIAQLIEIAKANPGKYAYGTPGIANIGNFAAEEFKKRAGVELRGVPYKGGAPLMTDLLGGHIPIAFLTLLPTIPMHNSGKLRILGVTTAKRSEFIEDVPAIAETIPGYDIAANLFVVAPPKTPDGVADKLNQALQEVLRSPEIKKQFADQSTSLRFGGRKELEEQIRTEVKLLGEIARRSNIKVSS